MQFSTTLLITLLPLLATAAPPAPPSATALPSVVITANTKGIDNPTGSESVPKVCPLNTLCTGFPAITALQVVAGSGQPVGTVDAAAVECRMYRDAQGTLPGSKAFGVKTQALVATNTVKVGAVLCYVLNAAEVVKV